MQTLIKKNIVTALIPGKVNFNTINITKYKEGCYLKIKGSIHQEDIIILNF